jgi:hypothetical protein
MNLKSLEERYDIFTQEAEEMLDQTGWGDEDKQKNFVMGRPLYDLFSQLTNIYFPEDSDFGKGPKGIIQKMYTSFEDKSYVRRSSEHALAMVIRNIINNRPPLDLSNSLDNAKQSPFFEQSRNYKEKEKMIFVLMPFSKPWSERIWKDHISIYLSNVDGIGELTVQRADDMYGQCVMEDVFEGIYTAGLIIAECTERNPNVLYELGMAHVLGKRTVLLSQNVDDIPFDLQRFRFCIYEDNSTGYPKLKKFLWEVAREVFSSKK